MALSAAVTTGMTISLTLALWLYGAKLVLMQSLEELGAWRCLLDPALLASPGSPYC